MSEEAEGPVTCNVIVVARRHVLRAIRWKDEEEYGLRANGRVGRGICFIFGGEMQMRK